MTYRGRLLRVVWTLRADAGDALDVEATVFVPDLAPGEAWHLPNCIGLEGLLNRVRFAVDPAENVFYFGAV